MAAFLEKIFTSFWLVIVFLQEYDGAVTALATIAIGIFTFCLVIVTNRQARLTREAIALTRQELISTHRPRIILRDVHLIAETIHYMLVNVGDTAATVVESRITAEFVEHGNRMLPFRSSGHDDLGRVVFAGGEAKDLTCELPAEISFHIKFPMAQRIGHGERGPSLGERYFVGALIYADDLGVKRRSTFRRRWDDASLTFVRLSPDQERDHEYAD